MHLSILRLVKSSIHDSYRVVNPHILSSPFIYSYGKPYAIIIYWDIMSGLQNTAKRIPRPHVVSLSNASFFHSVPLSHVDKLADGRRYNTSIRERNSMWLWSWLIWPCFGARTCVLWNVDVGMWTPVRT